MQIETDKLKQAGQISGVQDLIRLACCNICKATGDDKAADLLIEAWAETKAEAIDSLNLDNDQIERVQEYIGPFKPENRMKEAMK